MTIAEEFKSFIASLGYKGILIAGNHAPERLTGAANRGIKVVFTDEYEALKSQFFAQR